LFHFRDRHARHGTATNMQPDRYQTSETGTLTLKTPETLGQWVGGCQRENGESH